MLERVYRGSIAYWNIRIVPGFAGFYSLNDRPFTLGNVIYMKDHDPAVEPDTLVHECCHVWQYQHYGSRYIMEALAAQAAPGAYDWQGGFASGAQRWQDLNPESEAQFIMDGWRHGDIPGGTQIGHG